MGTHRKCSRCVKASPPFVTFHRPLLLCQAFNLSGLKNKHPLFFIGARKTVIVNRQCWGGESKFLTPIYKSRDAKNVQWTFSSLTWAEHYFGAEHELKFIIAPYKLQSWGVLLAVTEWAVWLWRCSVHTWCVSIQSVDVDWLLYTCKGGYLGPRDPASVTLLVKSLLPFTIYHLRLDRPDDLLPIFTFQWENVLGGSSRINLCSFQCLSRRFLKLSTDSALTTSFGNPFQ